MKIIEWNCQGAFRKKHENILSQKPDILIVPECESEEKLKFGKLTPKPNQFIWFGDSPNKGIGIFSYSDFKIETLTCYNPNFRYIIPIKVTKGKKSFLLFAIWAMDNKDSPETRYIGQIWLAINFYKKLLNLPIVLSGDFNSNKIWDDKKRVGNHSDMVSLLKNHQIESIYHYLYNEEQGEESQNTFFMYRKEEKPYHIDYFFTSKHFFENSISLKIEKFSDWKNLSDHVPLILETTTPEHSYNIEYNFSQLVENQLKELSEQTKARFNDIIFETLKQAKKLDNITESDSVFNERKSLAKKIEQLKSIEKLLEGL